MASKIAIVTGYSSGLGRSLAEILLEHDWAVIGVARRTRAEDLEKRYPGLLHHVLGSVADQKTVDHAFDKADSLGGARLVVNCAGQGVYGEVGSYTAGDVHSALEGSLAGLIIFSDRAVTHMANRGGDIVNVMSTAAKRYNPMETVYTAAKWGAKAYTRALRDAVKGKKPEIRIFEVYPCGMKTSFWEDAIRPASDPESFPEPRPIAEDIFNALTAETTTYQTELTFKRR